MKRNVLLFAVAGLAIAAIIVSATGCVGALPEGGSQVTIPSPAGFFSQQNTGIWVSGEGKVTVRPDVAILNVGIESQALTVTEAQQKAADAMTAVMDELERQGVAEKDITTQTLSVQPVKRWQDDQEILEGYLVTNMVTVKIRDVDNAGTVIDAVVQAGGDLIRVDGISFTVDDPTVYYGEAREKAMLDAKAKAQQLANAAGIKLGDPTYITESGAYIPYRYDYYLKGAESAPVPAATTPISPGEMEITLTVQIAYSID
jgi:hypothetical protein